MRGPLHLVGKVTSSSCESTLPQTSARLQMMCLTYRREALDDGGVMNNLVCRRFDQ